MLTDFFGPPCPHPGSPCANYDRPFIFTSSPGCGATSWMRHHPSVTLSVGFRVPVSQLQPCYPSYGAPTLAPVGLPPTGRASLRWTHNDWFLRPPIFILTPANGP